MIKEIFRIISIWIIVLPFIAGFINYKGLNRNSRWIFFLVIAALLPQLLTFIVKKHTIALNVSYNIYTLIEFVFLSFLFDNKYQQPAHQFIVRITQVMYTGIIIFLFIKNGIATRFLNELVCINNIIYIVWISLFLKEQYNLPDTSIQRGNAFAWYLLALLIYAPCTVIVFALYYYIRGANPILQNLWVIQSVCNIILYIFFSVGLFIPKQEENIKVAL
jgi:hypothetical protein